MHSEKLLELEKYKIELSDKVDTEVKGYEEQMQK
jgi:hypothetical protein